MPFCSNCGHETEQVGGLCPSCEKSKDGGSPSSSPLTAITLEKGFFTSLFDFSMKEIITPKIIRILFVISVLTAGLIGLIMLITSFAGGVGVSILGLILIPIGFIISVIFIRVYLELIVVIFNIYNELKDIRHQTMLKDE